MTTKNAAKSVVAAAFAAALSMGAAAAPALAATAAAPKDVAIVAQSCSSDYAIDAAVTGSPIGWDDVYSIDWHYDAGTDDYVVTVTSWWGDWWTVWVDAATGNAYAIY